MSTQTQGMRGAAAAAAPIRGYRRRKAAPVLDLNVPAVEARDDTGASNQGVQSRQQGQHLPPATIDVEALDDDVIESSPRAFAEAKNNAQRTRRRNVIDLDSERTTRVTCNNRHKRRRVPSSQPVISCDQYINLESSSCSTRESVQSSSPPQPQPTFSCPICMGPFVEETSTKCGHIFCKQCIKTAMSVQAKCPTCRKRVTAKELIRVFLPSTR
ncbi:hypothetical protein Tsubulata_010504 [Turnera subulata]|uniref:RING-type domain-containing protein n=1 Tax=Turnera subulata TaxID=218843 RepID=A0A9Q0FC77_9ROSI|nr:hypothetical protein Tsubulata_010504 [Turnera subulata]